MTVPTRIPAAAPTHECQPQMPSEAIRDGRLLATPYARSLARTRGIELSEITTTSVIHGGDVPAVDTGTGAGMEPPSVLGTNPQSATTSSDLETTVESAPAELATRIAGTFTIPKTAEADAIATAAAVLAGLFVADIGSQPIEAVALYRHGRSASPATMLINGSSHGGRESIDSALRSSTRPDTVRTAMAAVHYADEELQIEELEPQSPTGALVNCGIGGMIMRPCVKYVEDAPILAMSETVRISLSSTRLSTATLADVFSAIGDEFERWRS